MTGQNHDKIVLAICRSLRAGDNRVAIPPEGIARLKAAAWDNGKQRTQLRVLVQQDAGARSGYSDEEYTKAGAEIVGLRAIMRRAHILVDVKQRKAEYILPDGVNIFYAHVEKGQAPDYLRELLSLGSATLYSPETIFIPTQDGQECRGVNLGYWAGVGAVHLAFEGIRISNEQRGIERGPFASFPEVATSEIDDINDAYVRFTDDERQTKVAIIGSERGLVASGALYEFDRAHLEPVMLGRSVTSSPERLAEALGFFDAIINASQWYPGEPRIITRRQIAAMREGAVFIDATCDADGSSRGVSEGNPVVGGVRWSVESKWTDPHLFYWVGLDEHTADNAEPAVRTSTDLRVLYSANGMIPGGRSTARAASRAYAEMLFPYLVNIIRAVSMEVELPSPGLVLRRGSVVHPGLRDIIKTNEQFADLRQHCRTK